MEIEEKINVIMDYHKQKKERTKAILHNVYEDLRTMYLFIIGLPLAFIFWLAWKGIVYSLLNLPEYSSSKGIFFVLLIFIYGCIFHDLMIPYLKKPNYVKVPYINLGKHK